MKGLDGLESPCVCGRNYSWRRILAPNKAKGDHPNWIVCFARGLLDERWKAWCAFLSSTPSPIDFNTWGVLLVTNETPEEQLLNPYYQGRFDCATVRLLSDVSGSIGPSFGITLEDGQYPFTLFQVQEGKIMNRFL